MQFKTLLAQAVGVTLITIGVASTAYGTHKAWDLLSDNLVKK